MGYRALELVIQSAQGLRNAHNAPQLRKMKPFALVSICDNNNNPHSSEEQTPIDSEGNTNPKWNFRLTFNIDITRVEENHLALVVKLKSRRITGNRDVGEVRVLITELEGFGDAKAVAERHVSKNVVNLDGTSQQGQGTLNFSYKFGNTVQQPPASTVKIGNYSTPNVQRRPGTARRLAEKLTGDFGSALVSVGVPLATTAALAKFFSGDDPSGVDPPGADSSAADPSGVDPPGADSSAVDPPGVEPSGADSSAADPSGVEPSGADSSAADPSGVEPSGAESSAADPSGVDPSGAESSAADPSGADPFGTESSAADPSGVDPSGADSSADYPYYDDEDNDGNYEEAYGTESSAADPSGVDLSGADSSADYSYYDDDDNGGNYEEAY